MEKYVFAYIAADSGRGEGLVMDSVMDIVGSVMQRDPMGRQEARRCKARLVHL